MIPGTVNTCRACRAFRRPADHSVVTSRLPTQFNERVQHDVLYLTINKPVTTSLWFRWAAHQIWSLFYPETGMQIKPHEQHHNTGGAASSGGQGSSSSTTKDPEPPDRHRKPAKWSDKTFKQEPCSHIMDMCTRLCQAQRIPDREPHTFIKVLTNIWFRPLVHLKSWNMTKKGPSPVLS